MACVVQKPLIMRFNVSYGESADCSLIIDAPSIASRQPLRAARGTNEFLRRLTLQVALHVLLAELLPQVSELGRRTTCSVLASRHGRGSSLRSCGRRHCWRPESKRRGN